MRLLITSPLTHSTDPSRRTEKTSRILVVDDDSLLRECLCMTLESEGFQCVEADNGLHGFKKLVDNSFDAIISDNQMPVMTGVEFYKKVKERYSENTPPAILMSGDLDAQLTETAASLGFSGVFTKAVHLESLLALLHSILNDPHSPVM